MKLEIGLRRTEWSLYLELIFRKDETPKILDDIASFCIRSKPSPCNKTLEVELSKTTLRAAPQAKRPSPTTIREKKTEESFFHLTGLALKNIVHRRASLRMGPKPTGQVLLKNIGRVLDFCHIPGDFHGQDEHWLATRRSQSTLTVDNVIVPKSHE
ncbi:hypothetical protein E4U43_006869 [Claviceps pusilla]|uniref:Uncharacterized protein n=1 Tax=Claviceps pusilla TaxID=123648 RepID=A0A9P7NFQ4_9HYPO|nr:hypothetical protein E4U43_006869 [Claviceps pusilla]